MKQINTQIRLNRFNETISQVRQVHTVSDTVQRRVWNEVWNQVGYYLINMMRFQYEASE